MMLRQKTLRMLDIAEGVMHKSRASLVGLCHYRY